MLIASYRSSICAAAAALTGQSGESPGVKGMLDRRDEERAILHAWGDVLRRYRHWKRLSRRELAQQAGISPVFLGEIERGEKDPSSHTLSLIANALDAPLAELYLRVATRLHVPFHESPEQNALPLSVGEVDGEYLSGVPLAKDETAFDLYKVSRLLRTDHQVSLLVLARSLLPEDT
jgi:transcriptional regulator with XRE-family HTH domain